MKALIPPVGYPILMRGGDSNAAQTMLSWPGYRAHFLASGTAALAAAMIIARDRQPQIRQPEVILPAYGCPDLVAAALFAGLLPVLVDTEADYHGYDLARLADALGAATVAVVAVNLLGVHERRDELKALLKSQSSAALLIEDDAQWLPEPLQQADTLVGDCAVLSFGRGKPLPLLGGGALLLRDDLEAAPPRAAPVPAASLMLRARIIAYNALLHPRCYGFVSRLPGLNLGATELHALPALAAMDSTRLSWLPANLQRHVQRPRQHERLLAELLSTSSALTDMAALAPAGHGRLLRYPLLTAERAQRDALEQRLLDAGWGATGMYRRPLYEIDGVAARVRVQGQCDNAARFAGRLLTLPLQHGVSASRIAQLRSVLI